MTALHLPHVETFLTKILSEPKVSKSRYFIMNYNLLFDIVVFIETWFA